MLREGQAMARVTHPNVITVYEVGVAGSLVFLAQELLDSGTLGQWLEQPRTQAEILDKFISAGRGLAAAHAAGLVHRDFKPDNVLLGKDGRVRVADFGLARALGPDEEDLPAATRANMARAQLDLSRNPMSPLTRTGAVLGTPMFMAPEQHNGERADERSDQFSFAVALYQALYGAWPFAGKTSVALADAVIAGRLEPPPTSLAPWLRKIVLRGLATRPADRYPSMDALLADLARPPRRRGRTIALAGTALVLAAGAVVGGYALATHDASEPRAALPTIDPELIATDRGIEWLGLAIERDQLDDAAEKYDLAAALAQQNAQATPAAIAWAEGALVLALRGNLEPARTHLARAQAITTTDATALAYADLATAAIAAEAGDLEPALARSAACAKALAPTIPELAALCWRLHGDVVADRGDTVLARDAYRQAKQLAKRAEQRPLELAIDLAVAALDLDDGAKVEALATTVANLQAAAEQAGAAAATGHAEIVLARAHIAQAATQQALTDLEHIKPEAIETFDTQIEARIARGQAYALLGDTDTGYADLDGARTAAESHGCRGLALAARLGRVEVEIALGTPGADQLQRVLISDARAHGFGRIAHLAETIAQR
jgi:predicted negative regulator of RcsB-dependent stress response